MTRLIFAAMIALTTCSGVLLGCSGQNDPYNSVPQIQLAGASCMDQISGQIHDYFNGQANANETRALWGCFHYVISMFSRYVENPNNPNQYTPQGLREFLETYFLTHEKTAADGHVISDRLLSELMELKRVFVGGSANVITRPEIQHTLTMLGHLQTISLNLLPYSRILFLSQGATPPSAQIDQSVQAMDIATLQLVKLMNGAPYTFSHMQALMKSIYNYLVRQNPKSSFADMSKFVPLFAQLKSVMLNSNQNAIEPTDWLPLARMASQIYAIVIRKRYYLTSDALQNTSKLNELVSMFLSVSGILKDATARRSNGAIPLGDINRVVDQALPLGIIPNTFDKPMIENFVKCLFDTILNPQNEFPQSGVSAPKIDYLEGQVVDWARVQSALINGKTLPTDPGWQEMEGVLNTPWPLITDADGRLVFNWQSKSAPNLASTTRLNWSRAIFHVLFHAYIQDKTRLQNYQLSRGELHKAYLDLKPILVSFGLDSPSDTTFDVRLFRDANLFMPKSNGDDFLSFNELIEYVQNVISGIDAGHIFLSEAQKSCELAGGLFDEACFRTLMQSKYSVLFNNMPGFRDYLGHLSASGWKSVLDNIESVVRTNGPSAKPMSQTDIDESIILLQYIETLMMRFDTNHDGQIGFSEGIKMMQLFWHTIAEALHITNNNNQINLQLLETYILNYGQLPDSSDPLAPMRLEHWQLQQEQLQWSLSIDRGRILQIIAYLSKLNI